VDEHVNLVNFLLGNATGRDHPSGEVLPVWENSMGEDKLLRKRILLVDDERFVRESIARLLS
jgi:CheY-like chemotaxis protein